MPFAPIVLALATLAGQRAGGQAVEKKMPPFEEMVRMRIVLSVAGMDAITSRRDLVYKTAEGEPLKMDVYAPAGPARGTPGPGRRRRLDQFLSMCHHAARRLSFAG